MKRINPNPYVVNAYSVSSMPTQLSHFGKKLTTCAYLSEAPDDDITPNEMSIPLMTTFLLLRDIGGDSIGTTAALYAWMNEMGLYDIHCLVYIDYSMLHVFEVHAREIIMRVCGYDPASGLPNYYKYTLNLLKNLTNDKTRETASDRYLREYGISTYRHLDVLHHVVGELNFRNSEEHGWMDREWDSLALTPVIVLEDFCEGRYR